MAWRRAAGSSRRRWHRGFSDRWFYEHGNFGVDIFFAISGILITSRLLEEEQTAGDLHLGSFYVRRLFRIQPAALLFLAVVGALHLASVAPLSGEAFLSALLLFRNFLQLPLGSGWLTSHFWSLSVEEHFYLLLPAFLVIVKRRRAGVLFGVLLALSAWIALGEVAGWITTADNLHTEVILPRLVLPSLVAVLLRREDVRKAVDKFLPPYAAILAAAVVLLPALAGWRAAGRVCTPLAPTLIVTSTALHPAAWMSRALEWPPLKFVGRISFSLYLWQQLFLVGHFAPDQAMFGRFSHAPLNFAAVAVAACLSFFLIERPFQRIGKRLTRALWNTST